METFRFASSEQLYTLDCEARSCAWCAEESEREFSLMRMAAAALAALVEEIAANMPSRPTIVAVFGKGDNGGDAILAGQILESRGYNVEYRAAYTTDSAFSARVPQKTQFESVDVAHCWTASPARLLPRSVIILDGILGIGIKGAPREPARRAIQWIREVRRTIEAVVVAVDVPSGLSADAPPDSENAQDVVCADFTLAMGLPKKSFISDVARAYCGEIRVAKLGSKYRVFKYDSDDVASREMEFCAEVPAPPREPNSNKGDFGHAVLFVGSRSYPGAAVLATLGALDGGAGLVTAVVPSEAAVALSTRCPEVILRQYAAPTLSPEVLASTLPLSGKVVLAGCGISQSGETEAFLTSLLELEDLSGLVLDADALNILARHSKLRLPSSAVITPHPGEAARLLGTSIATIQSDRRAAVEALAERYGCCAVLKGFGTLVCASAGGLQRTVLIAAGNPGLAKGGSGDILAGLLVSALARGLPPFEAACRAALLHGRAADMAAIALGQERMRPTDILGYMPKG